MSCSDQVLPSIDVNREPRADGVSALDAECSMNEVRGDHSVLRKVFMPNVTHQQRAIERVRCMGLLAVRADKYADVPWCILASKAQSKCYRPTGFGDRSFRQLLQGLSC